MQINMSVKPAQHVEYVDFPCSDLLYFFFLLVKWRTYLCLWRWCARERELPSFSAGSLLTCAPVLGVHAWICNLSSARPHRLFLFPFPTFDRWRMNSASLPFGQRKAQCWAGQGYAGERRVEGRGWRGKRPREADYKTKIKEETTESFTPVILQQRGVTRACDIVSKSNPFVLCSGTRIVCLCFTRTLCC